MPSDFSSDDDLLMNEVVANVGGYGARGSGGGSAALGRRAVPESGRRLSAVGCVEVCATLA